MEPDTLYYQRRITEELAAARRAVTGAARLRHFQLIEAFAARLEALGYPAPIAKDELERLKADCAESAVA